MTAPSPDTIRAALLLTNRLVRLDAQPLTAREFWQLADRVDVGSLFASSPAEIAAAAEIAGEEAARVRSLLDAATALSFEQERLADSGIEHVSALDERFPGELRERLGTACPTFLLVAGPIEFLGGPSLGVVGSRDASDASLEIARQAGERAVAHRWRVVSGLARGVDQAAMWAACDARGGAVGVPAEGIARAARTAEVRRRVHAGQLCLVSPYAPDTRFSAGSAMGRNRIIYGLSNTTLVVAAENGAGGTWGGAVEAIEHQYAPIAVWSGAGGGSGNAALAARGATSITDLDRAVSGEIPYPDDPAEQQALF